MYRPSSPRRTLKSVTVTALLNVTLANPNRLPFGAMGRTVTSIVTGGDAYMTAATSLFSFIMLQNLSA
jgi:hypothetical protein